MKQTLFIFITFLLVYSVNAQTDTPFDKKNIKDKKVYKAVSDSIKEGNRYFKSKIYKQALTRFYFAEEINPNNSDLNFKIGICNLNSAHKDNARPYFEKAYLLKNDIDEDINYYLGRSFQFEGNWDKAIEFYNKYNESKYASETKEHIQQCERAKELDKNPVKVKITNIGSGVNTPNAEYVPIISADESVMYFTGRYSNTTGGKKDYAIDDWMEDVYRSKKVNGIWQKSENLGLPVNSNDHDAILSLSSDGQILFIYRSENNNKGDIYICNLEGDDWTNPIPLNSKINTRHQETSVSLSPDGKTLYFVSSKPGGEGKKDIYVAHLNEKEEWDNVENIGKIINTDKNEEAVFIHPDGKTLYFSSEGHEGIGGYDIFMSILEDDKWSKPKNIGIPINTADDDVFFVLAASGKNAYYTSGKIGGLGEKDIYLIEFEEQEKNVTLLKGAILDEQNNPIVTSLDVYDSETNELLNSVKSNASTGEYLITLTNDKKYRIEIKYSDYPDITDKMDLTEINGYQEIEKDYTFSYQKKEIIPEPTVVEEPIISKPDYVYTLQYIASIEEKVATQAKEYLDKLNIDGVYIQKVIFTDTKENLYRVRSGKFDTFEEAQAVGNNLPLTKLPDKSYWIDNVRKEDYTVKKGEYNIILESETSE